MRMLLAILAMVVMSNAQARSATGNVNYLIVRHSDGLVYFHLKNVSNESARPACAVNPYFMIKDEKSEAGKQQLSMLLAAQAAGKRITVVGYDTCIRWGDGEDVNYIQTWAD